MVSAYGDDFYEYNEDFDDEEPTVQKTVINSTFQNYDPKTRVLGPSVEMKTVKEEGTSVHKRKELRKTYEQISYKSTAKKTENPIRRRISTESDEFTAKSYQIGHTHKNMTPLDEVDSNDNLEYIAKLQKANHALRKQLVIFSRALESSLQESRITEVKTESDTPNNRTSKLVRPSDDGKKSLRAIIASKEKALQSLKKKLDVCKKSNDNLKLKVQKAYTSERVIQMGNEKKEKDLQIQQLLEETRNLRNIQ
eukprot:CAMPEP_0204873874 /NCGR_PEP_ID=MMETSP1348-20121228/41810_1 /ASSEMBLY_ACC=CAM_ASM_000700 /TAXON_ID=215587 /ORGANISM="Aplanochytrium stocchinoi, Strain GSBS06" /LENGTH=251 /DNA_ID=CAMNT_0052029407 /DNA_START=320 /DNA_END=1072 /DNA_ORIENTATION=+